MGRDVSKYLEYASDDNIQKLNKIQNTYTSKISDAITEIGKVDLSGWEDSVSSKLSGLCSSMKDTYCKTINDEVSTGNLTNLIGLVTQLKNECNSYKDTESSRRTLPESDRLLIASGDKDKISDEGKSILRESEIIDGKLSTISSNIDNILLSISTLEFNKNYTPPDTTSLEDLGDDTGEEEASPTENLLGMYMVGKNGVAYSRVFEILERTDDGKMKRTYLTRDYDQDGNIIAERTDVIIIFDENNPSIGTVYEMDYDSNTFTETVVEYDPDNGLTKSWYKKDMDTGQIIIEAGNYENMPVTNDNYTVEIDSPDGKTSQDMNLGNPIEQAQFMLDYRKYSLQYDGADATAWDFQSFLRNGDTVISGADQGALSIQLSNK